MRYSVKLLADYHGRVWPHGKIGDVKEFEQDKFEQLVSDFGRHKLEITPLTDNVVEEVKATAIQKALGRLGKK